MKKNIFLIAFIFFLYFDAVDSLWAKKRDPFVSLEKSILKTETSLVSQQEKEISEILSGINLEGILYSSYNSYVIINEKVLKEGERIGEAIIKKILPHKVIFKYGEREAELKIEVPSCERRVILEK